MVEPVGVAKLLIAAGVGLVVLGGIVWATQHLPPGLRPFHLPGDIRIERDGFELILPIATMAVLSLLGTGILWLVHWWRS